MTQPSILDVAAAVRSVLGEFAGDARPSSRPAEDFSGRLLSLRHAEGLPWGIREIRVAPGTVVTPLARDHLKRQGIELRFVAASDVDGRRGPGEWAFAIETESGIIAALRRALLEESRPWRELEPRRQSAARWVGEAANRGALLLTDEASVAVWRACRVPGVRAAMATEVEAVDRAVQRLGVNLLVIEPVGKSINVLRQMSRAFRARGAPMAPAGFEQEDGSCVSPK